MMEKGTGQKPVEELKWNTKKIFVLSQRVYEWKERGTRIR